MSGFWGTPQMANHLPGAGRCLPVIYLSLLESILYHSEFRMINTAT
jgi:hypothetical protein